jgi:hypothetical protein
VVTLRGLGWGFGLGFGKHAIVRALKRANGMA